MNPTTNTEAGAVADVAAWRTIDSAPRDGSYFVTAKFPSDDGEYEITSYAPYNWKSYAETEPGSGLFKEVLSPMGEWTGSNMHRATHWCALPTPVRRHLEQGATAGVVGGKE